MAKLSEIYTFDKVSFEDGTWVTIGNGISVKLRSPQSAHSKATRKKLEAPFASLTRGGRELPDDIAENLLIQQMAQSLIIDWRGVDGEDGEPVIATPTTIEAALRTYQFFRDDVGSILASRDTYKNRVAETDLKN
jgi:hypothetical protein